MNDRHLNRDDATAGPEAGDGSARTGPLPGPRRASGKQGADHNARPRRGPTDEAITMIWRRAALLAVVLLVLTIALVVALKLSHTATGPPVSTTTTTH